MKFRGLMVIGLIIAIGGLMGGDLALSQNEAPSTQIINPSDLAAAVPGDQLQIEWVTANLDSSGTFEIWFRTPDGQWKVIEKREPGPGSLTWTVPEVNTTGVGRLWIGNLTNPEGETTEDKYEAFHETKLRFLQEGPAPSTRITNPSHGNSVTAGSELRIEWDAANLNPEGAFEIWVRLEGRDWKRITTVSPQPGSFTWTVPDVEQPTSAKIWVGNLTNADGESTVDQYEVFDQVEVRIGLGRGNGKTGALRVRPSQFNLQAQKGGQRPSQTVAIENAGDNPLDWKAETDAGWLSLKPNGGTLAAGANAQMQVSAAVANLDPGTHQTTIRITSPEARNSPISVLVTLSLERLPQGEPTVFATISDTRNGQVVEVDLSLLGTRTITRGMEIPEGIGCGPQGGLYVAEADAQRIVRMDRPGGMMTTVANGAVSPSTEAGYAPSFFTFAPNGDLIFTTRELSEQPFTGLWRLPQGADPNDAKQILSAEAFPDAESLKTPIFLKSGPYAGDLLLALDSGRGEQAEVDRVVRLPAPQFEDPKTFISTDAQRLSRIAGIALGPKGNVLVTDFDNRRIMQFGPDGSFKQEVASFDAAFPNQIAFDADGTMYVTTTVFGGRDTGALQIIQPNGQRQVIGGQKGILGLAVCQ